MVGQENIYPIVGRTASGRITAFPQLVLDPKGYSMDRTKHPSMDNPQPASNSAADTWLIKTQMDLKELDTVISLMRDRLALVLRDQPGNVPMDGNKILSSSDREPNNDSILVSTIRGINYEINCRIAEVNELIHRLDI